MAESNEIALQTAREAAAGLKALLEKMEELSMSVVRLVMRTEYNEQILRILRLRFWFCSTSFWKTGHLWVNVAKKFWIRCL